MESVRCQDVRLEMLAYLEGELTEAEAGAVKEHLLACPACSREFVAVQAAERDLREGLEQEPGSPCRGKLGSWVTQRAAKLKAEEIAGRRKWVAGLWADQASSWPSAKRRLVLPRFCFRAVALAAVLSVLLFALWPQVVRVSAQVPTLGDWVRQMVFKDAGLAWAYEHGYISQHQDSVSRGGVKFSILGTLADPVQTTVIYLVEGMAAHPRIEIRSAVSGERLPLYSWAEQQVNTPLGIVGMVHTEPLPAGTQELKITLKDLGLELDIAVTREPVSRVSREYDLKIEETVGITKLKFTRLVLTPTQVGIDYSISGAVYLRRSGHPLPLPYMYLVDGEGNRQALDYSVIGNPSDSDWEGKVVFNRPRDISSLRLLICDWDILQPLKIDFAPEDVGKEVAVADSTLTLVAWERNGAVWGSEEILELHFKPGGLFRGVAKWSIDGYSPSVLQENHKGNIAVGFKLPRDPESVTAELVHLFVPGNWEIPLPNLE